MGTHEHIPKIQKGREFPVGDIVDAQKDKKVDQWLDAVSGLNHYRFTEYIAFHSKIASIVPTAESKTDRAARGLCHRWDYSYNNARRYTSGGYAFVRAFNRQTNYLPESNIDFSQELSQMTRLETQGGLIRSGREFGRVAWQSMAIYPNVHLTFLRLLEHAEPRYGIFSNKDRDCLKAGMALPFVLSWAAGMVAATPSFSCMSSYRQESENDFATLFHDDKPLAPNNPSDRH